MTALSTGGLSERLAELTVRMEHAARRADWTEVQRLMAERGGMLSGNPGVDDVTISNIVQSDRSVIELATIERDNLRVELEKISHGRRAVSAYEEA